MLAITSSNTEMFEVTINYNIVVGNIFFVLILDANYDLINQI